ncbi:hypothetical protein V6B16_11045 [Salinimicrobium catena]|uniref:hypothetical protein n=1 Tax=Salinimicrobium catena TaxID=390640 RepID=UPI002FE45126
MLSIYITEEEKILPAEIFDKAIVSRNEYGWQRCDLREVLDKAVGVGLAIIVGQVQFLSRMAYVNFTGTLIKQPEEIWKKAGSISVRG